MLSLGKKKFKCVASADLSPEAKKAKLMQKDWTKLNNMAYGVRKLSETYVEKYGELEEPPEIRHDPTLNQKYIRSGAVWRQPPLQPT